MMNNTDDLQKVSVFKLRAKALGLNVLKGKYNKGQEAIVTTNGMEKENGQHIWTKGMKVQSIGLMVQDEDDHSFTTEVFEDDEGEYQALEKTDYDIIN